MSDYTIRHYQPSGDRYAVEVRDGTIVRAAGPLHWEDPTDPDSIRDYLDNQDQDDARNDAASLFP